LLNIKTTLHFLNKSIFAVKTENLKDQALGSRANSNTLTSLS